MEATKPLSATEAITSGPIFRTIIRLAAPVVMGMFMEIALSVVNFFWVGKLGPTAQDAITSTMVIVWSTFTLISMITIGLSALVSRHIGAKEPEAAAHYIQQALYLALAVGVFVAVAGYFIAPVLLKFMNTSAETSAYALPYLRMMFFTGLLYAIADSCATSFRASGNTKTPLWVFGSAVVINIGLDPFLIFGIAPFPELGVTGAAVATIVANVFASSVFLWLIFHKKLGYAIGRIFGDRIDFAAIKRMVKISLPITMQQLTFSIVYWFLIKIVHSYGESAGAAMGIGNRMESLSYLTCYGFSLAASTMVGQNLGAKLPDRAAKCAWGAVWMAVSFTFVWSLALWTVPNWIASVFTQDPVVHDYARDYLIILGLSQFTMAIEIVLEGAFSGAGDTIPPMLVMIPGAVIRVPMAYFLCFTLDWGLNGVWWTLTITTTLKAAILAFWFSRGRWKTREVR